jgi:hypothetical protein
MRFTLQKLGRLEEATIDLGKDLIVLTGPNNTSKTYVAHAIYGLCKHSDALVRQVIGPRLPLDESASRVELDLPSLVVQHAEPALPSIAALYTTRLADVFAADDAFVARASTKVALDEGEAQALATRMLALEFHRESRNEGIVAWLGRVSFDKSAGSPTTAVTWLPPSFGASEGADRGVEERKYFSSLVLSFISTVLAETLLVGSEQVHILPAERSAIQLFSRELSINGNHVIHALAREASRKSHESERELLDLVSRVSPRRYPLPIRDALLVAEDVSTARKRTSGYAPLADELAREVIQGAIDVDAHGDVGFRPEGAHARIDLHLASSSVKALAGLDFYLRHLAQKGQFLIIDEPELNLHPASQRKVARLLARLARAGIKVMISTHSDYIIRELNNLIMLSADKTGELRDKHGYGEDEILRPEQVGAYVFDATHAEQIPLDTAGIEVAAIDREVREQNRTSRDIYFSLFEKDE